MTVLLVLDHPYAGSFSHALLDAARRGASDAGHDVDVIDLAADGFDPAMSVSELDLWRSGRAGDPLVLDYQRRMLEADHLAFVFPIWWMTMPARTKGFLDKVLLPGVAYDEPRPGGRLVGRLHRLRSVTLVTASTTPTIWYRLLFARPAVSAMFTGTFRMLGVRRLRWLSHGGMAASTPARREAWLERTERRFRALPRALPAVTPAVTGGGPGRSGGAGALG